MQARISATIDPKLRAFVDRFSAQSDQSLSDVLEMGLRLLQEKIEEEQMMFGYLRDEEESTEWSESGLNITSLNR